MQHKEVQTPFDKYAFQADKSCKGDVQQILDAGFDGVQPIKIWQPHIVNVHESLLI